MESFVQINVVSGLAKYVPFGTILSYSRKGGYTLINFPTENFFYIILSKFCDQISTYEFMFEIGLSIESPLCQILNVPVISHKC